MKVIHYIRKPLKGYYSFERVFRDIRAEMPEDVVVRVVYAWCHSRGFFGRALNCLQVLLLRGDLVHVTGDINYVVPFIIGRKSVLTVHDLAPLRPKSGWKRWIFKKLWYDWPVANADAVTTVSISVKLELEAVLNISDKDKIQAIYNGVDPDFKACPKSWPEKPIVLMIGTRPQKNLERMFEALRGFDVEVEIVGSLSNEQRSLADQFGIKMCERGFVEQADLIQIYQKADLLAFASTYEGFGLPIVEAQATGRPVLTSDTATLSEVAGKHGAVFVDPYNVDSIRSGFEEIITDANFREKLVIEGLKNSERFSVKKIAQEYKELYIRT